MTCRKLIPDNGMLGLKARTKLLITTITYLIRGKTTRGQRHPAYLLTESTCIHQMDNTIKSIN